MKKILSSHRGLQPILTQWPSRCSQVQAAAEQAPPNIDSPTTLKSWKELPAPPRWPILGHMNVYFDEDSKNGRMHALFKSYSDKYGKMFKIEILKQVPQVVVTDPKMVEVLMRQEDKFPRRPHVEAWADYRDMNGLSRALLTSDDETWWRYRKAISKRMMRPKNVNEYGEQLNEVMDDLVDHIRRMKASGDGVFVNDLANEFYRWSMEAACVVLFEKRFGCLKETVNPKSQKFIDNIEKMWLSSLPLYTFYNLHKRFKSKEFKKHHEAWSVIFDIAKDTIREKMVELEQSQNLDDEEIKGGLLSYLLSRKELSFEEIVSNVTELMLAGVDTTSNSLCFAVYLLAKNPEAKEKLYEEICRVVGDRSATTDDLQNMPYLKAVVKEGLRYFPVVALNGRVLKSPVVLGDYKIDEGCMIVFNIFGMCHDPETYKDPEKFMPERWLRGSSEKVNPFAAQPFGHGVRSCIGRRFAELELNLSLIKILQNFDLRPHGDMSQLQPFYRTVLSPGKIVPVQFHDRK